MDIVIEMRADFAAAVVRTEASSTLRGDGAAFFLTSTVFACEPQPASTITSAPAAMPVQRAAESTVISDLSPLPPHGNRAL